VGFGSYLVIHLSCGIMKKYFGLKGEALNWAVGIIAGCDFLLFGYGEKPRRRR
jgi:hypothetical protein